MKEHSSEPAFSSLSMCLLLVAIASALISIVREYEAVWPVADWICGISVVALIASLVRDARR